MELRSARLPHNYEEYFSSWLFNKGITTSFCYYDFWYEIILLIAWMNKQAVVEWSGLGNTKKEKEEEWYSCKQGNTFLFL